MPEATAPKLFTLPQAGSKPVLRRQDQSTDFEMPGEATSARDGRTRSLPAMDSAIPMQLAEPPRILRLLQSRRIRRQRTQFPLLNRTPRAPKSLRFHLVHQRSRTLRLRRHGHESLQELYLTDEPLDGVKVADMILQLPRVSDVVIMLSDGAALGGRLSGGLSEPLLSRTPDFVKHLLDFTKSIQGGPVKFVTFSGHACQVSLTIDENVLILTGHEGKNLPPGLRERLVATAQALNMIYGLQS